MAKALKAILLLLALSLLAAIPAVASARTENSGGAFRITAQQGPPSVFISASPGVQVRLNSPVPVTATFSEPVSGFTLDDISVVNGTTSGFSGSDGDSVYTFDVTPDSLGEVTVNIAAGVATDGGGTGNTAAPRLSLGLPYDFDGSEGISRNEAIEAIVDYFAGRITRAQTIAVIVLYFSTPTEPEPGPMVMQSLTPGEELMLEHPSGAMIEIPADATAGPEGEELMVSVEEVAAPEENVLPVAKVFDFSVVDQDGGDVPLREPVEITLPYTLPEGKTELDLLPVYWDEQYGRWEPVEGGAVDVTGQTLTVEMDHLTDIGVTVYLAPEEFLATVALSLAGVDAIGALYEAGNKFLVAFHGDVVVPVKLVGVKLGATLVLDVNDILSMDEVFAARSQGATEEGKSGFFTFGLNGHFALTLPEEKVTVSAKFGLTNTGKDGSGRNYDLSFDSSITVFSLSVLDGFFEVDVLTFNDNGNMSPIEAQLDTCFECHLTLSPESLASTSPGSPGSVEAEVLSTTLNMAKGEFNTNFSDVAANIAAGECSNFPCKMSWSTFVDSYLNWIVEGPLRVVYQLGQDIGLIYDYTSFEDVSPEVASNTGWGFVNQIESFTGGADVNGDGKGDMVFPAGVPGGVPFQIWTTGDKFEPKRHFLELLEVPVGWSIEVDGPGMHPSLNHEEKDPAVDALLRVDYDADPLSFNLTNWRITVSEDAPDAGTFRFRLVDNRSYFRGLIGQPDMQEDDATFTLWKRKQLSDLGILVEANPNPLREGETLTYAITVENRGPARADGVELHMFNVEVLGLELQQATLPNGPLSCADSIQLSTLVCELGDLERGESIEATLQFTTAASFPPDTPVSASFAVKLGESTGGLPKEELTPQDNSADVTVATAATSDRMALIALYNATGGDNWIRNRHWLSGKPVGQWYGVRTDDLGRVTGLDLYYNGLTGQLPSELKDLIHLEELSLSSNRLTGPVPPELGGLTGLKRLLLTGNRLEGAIPSSLGQLSNLEKLYLSGNNLEGPIPSELGALGNLQVLDLARNNLTGAIPSELEELSKLQELRLHNNNLEGQIPSWLAGLTGLQRLYLAGNNFTGCVPEGLAEVPRNDLSSLGLQECGRGNEALVSISAGSGHTCGLRADGSVICWGNNDQGQTTPPPGAIFTSLSAGSGHTCGLRADGSVLCWGRNESGESTPPAGETFTSIHAAGGSHTCGLKADGTPVCWGENTDRTGSVSGQITPPQGEKFSSISGGGNHTCGLRADGTVVCWGSDIFGESSPPSTTLAYLSEHSYFHTCGLRADGTAVCWGISFFGVTSPPTGEIFSSIGSGDRHTCGLRPNGTVRCWGSDYDGRGIFQGKLTPPQGNTFTAISVGWNHTCGLTADSTVACWGDNSRGQSSPPSGTAFARNPAEDFNGPADLGIDNPWGIWSDGSTMWVGFYHGEHKIYAYDMTSKARVPSKEFDTLSAAGNEDARGLWSDGQTMWVADRGDSRIYAYNMTTKARDSSKEFNRLDRQNNRVEGIWSNGTTMWVADLEGHKLYAYDMSTKGRVPGADIAANFRPTGLWSDGATMWVADLDYNKIYAYDMTTKARDASKEFNTLSGAGNDNPVGIWSDGETMWVVDVDDNKIYAYNMPR